MKVQTANDLRYYQFETLSQPDLVHGVFARHGGVSPRPFHSLNMAMSVGDSRENVVANRTRAFQALGRAPASVADLWQVHSAEVVVAETPRPEGRPSPKADALITNRPELTLFLRFADCVPILLFDPKHHAVGLVHAGWRGTLQRIAAVTVKAMRARYGTQPHEVLAGIGPSIGPRRYEVGPEVVAATRAAFNGRSDELLPSFNGRTHLDLWAANALQLQQAGVEQIEVSDICTASSTHDFFSHRGEHGQTGRFGALIALR
jgi:YfiH family protein